MTQEELEMYRENREQAFKLLQAEMECSSGNISQKKWNQYKKFMKEFSHKDKNKFSWKRDYNYKGNI